jgi:drug/metabolite transporter (DMT)-like permease
LIDKRGARFVPLLFVLLWASGFIVARLVRPYAEPESFVSLRFALSAALLFVIATIGGARWPRTARGWINGLIAGALMQGVYVGCVFWSIKNGLPPAIAALISGLQPLLTGMLATPLLGERVGPTRWIGIGVGFAGAVLVIAPNLSGTAAVPPITVATCLIGMLGITLGTIWQKRIGGQADLRSGASLQFIGGLLVTVPLMLTTEHGHVGTHIDVWIGLAWAVIGLSVITTLLLLWLIKGGAVAKIASLFYLVPPVTALMAFALFGEALAPIQFVGMAVAAAGVAIANRG